jgi:hypothetical protein
VDREHPDVVIEEFVERMLMRPAPGNHSELWGAGVLRELSTVPRDRTN